MYTLNGSLAPPGRLAGSHDVAPVQWERENKSNKFCLPTDPAVTASRAQTSASTLKQTSPVLANISYDKAKDIHELVRLLPPPDLWKLASIPYGTPKDSPTKAVHYAKFPLDAEAANMLALALPPPVPVAIEAGGQSAVGGQPVPAVAGGKERGGQKREQ